jgi:hypothetical protein
MRTRFRLQPGTYTVTYRSRNATPHRTFAGPKDITIESGRSTTLNF